ncbi:MAG: Response regulator receiver [Rhodocyclaceae bacterium]|nr:Response regulator receiver [Rhodocyclaceae bacterium]
MQRENDGRAWERRRALVVDDSVIARTLAAAMLAKRDFDVTQAEDAQNALRRLQDHCFDLVLLDIGLPGMSGTALCQVLRHELGMVDLPIIAYTAHGELTSLARMRLAGFDDFLIKPVSMGALDLALDHAFAH